MTIKIGTKALISFAYKLQLETDKPPMSPRRILNAELQ